VGANTIPNLITEVLGMKVVESQLYEELRDIEREMTRKLQQKKVNSKIKFIYESELKDISTALRKLECGDYGKCEMSGELMPFDLLTAVPTAKTIADFNKMKTFYKKPHTYDYN
jgi:RNA polymerase-binding transcription factor DksA